MKHSLGDASASGFPLAGVEILGIETTRLGLNKESLGIYTQHGQSDYVNVG